MALRSLGDAATPANFAGAALSGDSIGLHNVPGREVIALERVDEMVAAFRDVEGFVRYTFATWAEPEAIRRLEGDYHDYEGREIVRSFRYEAWRCIAHVTVHGSPRSAQHRHVACGLMRAGYERWIKFDDETDFRRGLSGLRNIEQELAFLASLGDDDAVHVNGGAHVQAVREAVGRGHRAADEDDAITLGPERACNRADRGPGLESRGVHSPKRFASSARAMLRSRARPTRSVSASARYS